MLGADRFYLGYPALGLLKFSTLGFFFLGQLLDIILLAGGALGPADGSREEKKREGEREDFKLQIFVLPHLWEYILFKFM